MYYLIRCGCGRVLYAKEGVATRKCVCGKTLKVKQQRIFKTVQTNEEAAEAVQEMQAEIYENTDFQTADKIKRKKWL